MILPTRHLRTESALIYTGGIISNIVTNQKLSVDQLWHKTQKEFSDNISDCELTYDWFVLALTMLFTINIVEFRDGRIEGVNL